MEGSYTLKIKKKIKILLLWIQKGKFTTIGATLRDKLLKVDLHSIRFSSTFVRFCTFFLIHEKGCSFSFAFLHDHICTNRTITYWTKVFRKKFLSAVESYFETSLHRSYTKFLSIYNSLAHADKDL